MGSPCPLQDKKNHPQTLPSESFIELFQKYKDNTMPQSFVGSNAAQHLETALSFYLRLFNTLQTLTKPCNPFLKSAIRPITQQTGTDRQYTSKGDKQAN